MIESCTHKGYTIYRDTDKVGWRIRNASGQRVAGEFNNYKDARRVVDQLAGPGDWPEDKR